MMIYEYQHVRMCEGVCVSMVICYQQLNLDMTTVNTQPSGTVKVDWIQDVLHSLTTAFHQQFTLRPVSLACAVTAVAENPAQINGGNINTEETEAKY